MSGSTERTEEEIQADVKDLQTAPLFMRELPKDDAGENDALEALRTLIYDGSPAAIAGNLKFEANDHFKQRNFKQALAFYSQAINETGTQIPHNLKRALYGNRAQCHLELRNYGSCIRDCAEVLSTPYALNPEEDDQDPSDAEAEYHKTTGKALFRSAKALFALDKYRECLDALERLALHAPPLDYAGNQLLDRVKDKLAQQAQYAAAREAREREKAQKEYALVQELKRLHVILPPGWTPSKASAEAPPPFGPPRFSHEYPEVLVFPVFLLQPCSQPPSRDLIPEWLVSGVSLADQLHAFADSDPAFLSAYKNRVDDVEVYATTSKGRMLKLGKNLDLDQALAQAAKTKDGSVDGLDLVGGWSLELYLVPRGAASQKWIAEMKADMKARGLVAQ